MTARIVFNAQRIRSRTLRETEIFARSLGDATVDRAKELAPRGKSGRLKNSIKRRGVRRTPNGFSIEIYADTRIAPHAPYVIGGTNTPILPRSARVLTNRNNPFDPSPVFYRGSVRGQAANDFLTEAGQAVRQQFRGTRGLRGFRRF